MGFCLNRPPPPVISVANPSRYYVGCNQTPDCRTHNQENLSNPVCQNFRIFISMKVNSHILPEILQKNLPAIQEICHKHKVKRLWAFGSVLRDDFTENSDIDLLYELDEGNITDEEYLENYYGLIEKLKQIFERKIDFVHYPSMKNPYFIKSVEATKSLLYAQRPEEVSV